MDRLVDKRIDHDDMLCRDAENEPVFRQQRDEDFADWLDAREGSEIEYFATH